MALALKIAAGLVIVYALLLLATQFLQRRLMYFPDPTRVMPSSLGLPQVEEIELKTADGESVLAWWGRAKPGRPTILYFHGNAGSFASRPERIRRYLERGIGMFMMSYRGYSGSTGRPSERANVVDALLAYDTLVAKGVAPADIILYGESLGTGVAVQVAAERKVGGIILDAPYTSMVDLARLHYAELPLRWLMTDRYETLRSIGRVTAPLLIIHGEEDDLIPVEMGRQVLAAVKGPKQMVAFPGAGHADHYLFGSYDAIFAWIDRLQAGVHGRAAE